MRPVTHAREKHQRDQEVQPGECGGNEQFGGIHCGDASAIGRVWPTIPLSARHSCVDRSAADDYTVGEIDRRPFSDRAGREMSMRLRGLVFPEESEAQ